MNANDLSMNRMAALRGPIRRVGLLSPTSGNLGNAAMQWAMIVNLRKRIPGVDILGITLDPVDTRRRHGIEAFPLAGRSRPYYSLPTSAGAGIEKQSTLNLGSIKRALRQIPVLRSVLRFVRSCVMEMAHIYAAARVVRKLDRMIVPGGGALDDSWGGAWGQPWAFFKWSLISRMYGVPFLFVSIGRSSLTRLLSRFFFGIAFRAAAYRSYRDPNTKSTARTLIDSDNDPVYPDLAFSYPCPPVRKSHDNFSDRLVVGVSPIAYCDPRVWPQKDEQRYRSYLHRLAEFVTWLLRERHRVFFFTTDSPDIATVCDVQALISEAAIQPDVIEILPSSMEQSPDSLLKGICHADLIVASRLHGVILSHLDGIPVLALSFDPKVNAHMSTIGQEEYCLDIDRLELNSLVDRFTALRAARLHAQSHIRASAQLFRQRLDLQYDQILGKINSSPLSNEDQVQLCPPTLSDAGITKTS